jgi:hypothetical protein
MAGTPAKRRVLSSRRSAARNVTCVKPNADSDSDSGEEAVKPSHASRKDNVGSKRKRVSLGMQIRADRQTDSEESTYSSSASDIELGEEEFEIDSIIDSRIRKVRGKPYLEYRIHWKGYESDDDSWTAANQFDDDDPPVLEFFKNFPSKPSTANLKPARAQAKPVRDTPASPAPKAVTAAPASIPTPPVAETNTSAIRQKDKEASVVVVVGAPPAPKVNSSPIHSKSTDIRFFFGGLMGKENRDPASSGKGKEKEKEKPKPEQKEAVPKPQKAVEKVEKAKPRKKKRKVEDKDDDFIASDDKEDVLDDDFESAADEDDEDRDAVVGDDDLESDRESGKSTFRC